MPVILATCKTENRRILMCWKSAQANSSPDSHLQNNQKYGSSGRVPTLQAQSPELKSKTYHEEEKKRRKKEKEEEEEGASGSQLSF
jgi:hypothetical protein